MLWQGLLALAIFRDAFAETSADWEDTPVRHAAQSSAQSSAPVSLLHAAPAASFDSRALPPAVASTMLGGAVPEPQLSALTFNRARQAAAEAKLVTERLQTADPLALDHARRAATAAKLAAEQLVKMARQGNARDAERRIQQAVVEARRQFSVHSGSVGGSGVADLQTASLLSAGQVQGSAECGLNCSGHGSCVNSLGGAKCECHSDWRGRFCDSRPCLEDCNGRGLCISGGCICDAGFLGQACERKRCPADCSGHGYCFDGKCQCESDYGGETCSQVMYIQKPTPDPKTQQLLQQQLHQQAANGIAALEVPFSAGRDLASQTHVETPVKSRPAPPRRQVAPPPRPPRSSYTQISWPALPSRGEHVKAEALLSEFVDGSKPDSQQKQASAPPAGLAEVGDAEAKHPLTASWMQDMLRSPKLRAAAPAPPPVSGSGMQASTSSSGSSSGSDSSTLERRSSNEPSGSPLALLSTGRSTSGIASVANDMTQVETQIGSPAGARNGFHGGLFDLLNRVAKNHAPSPGAAAAEAMPTMAAAKEPSGQSLFAAPSIATKTSSSTGIAQQRRPSLAALLSSAVRGGTNAVGRAAA